MRTSLIDSSTADVVVVGGGIIGLSVAYELASRGRDVVVIDRDMVGAGCAAGSAGHIVPSHVVPLAAPGAVRDAVGALIRPDGPLSMRWTMGPTLWRWLASFVRSCTSSGADSAAPALAALGALSATLINDWIAENDISCDRGPGGVIDVYGQERAFEIARSAAEVVKSWGVSVEILDAVGVRTLEPAVNDSTVGGVRFPDDGVLHPQRFLEGLASAAERRGVTLVSGAELVAVGTTSNVIDSLRTTRGEISARHVVFATGAWSGALAKLLGEKVPVVPGRGFSLTVDRPTQGPRHGLLLGEKHIAVGPMGDELRLSGRLELGRFDRTPIPRRIEQIERLARSRLLLDERLTVRDTWSGLRPMTPDGVPIISRSSRWENATIATGHAMIGLSLGPGSGRLAAQLVAGEPTDVDTRRFSVARFQ
jgi:D-amino-acid dehydrogenase